MELEQEDQIQIKKKRLSAFIWYKSLEREGERPIELEAKFAHSQLQKFYEHLRTHVSQNF